MGQILTYAFCLGTPIALSVVLAIFGTRARLRGAEQIRSRIARGDYEKMARAPIRGRNRVLLVAELGLILGMVIIVVAAIFQPALVYSVPGLAATMLMLVSGLLLGVYLSRLLSKPPQ
jgi:hypothetical protein